MNLFIQEISLSLMCWRMVVIAFQTKSIYFIVDWMSSEKLYMRVPHDLGHAHFYDTIQSFPGLHAGPSFEDREKYIRDTIRYQLLSTTPEQAKRLVNLRQCFRLQDRSEIEFCLQKKVPGVSLRQAAEELGLRK